MCIRDRPDPMCADPDTPERLGVDACLLYTSRNPNHRPTPKTINRAQRYPDRHPSRSSKGVDFLGEEVTVVVITSDESGDVISIDVHDEGEQANLPEIQGYDWAPYEPRTHATRFRWGNDLGDLVERTKVFGDEVEDGLLWVKVCAGNERICHGKGAAKLEFFYVYAYLFHDLGLTVPFADWQMAVLRQIQCAPTQIHPNAWASMQAFDTRPTASKGWVSFLGANKSLFTFYLASYKGFKTGFFKVVIPGRGRKYILDEEGRPKFPLYWTAFPPPTDPWAEDRLTPAERADLAVLKTLPDKIPPRLLIQCLCSPDLPRAIYDIMALTTVSNAEFLARAKTRRREEDAAEEVAPLQSVPAAPSTASTPATVAPTGALGVATRPHFVVKAPGSAAAGTAVDKGKKSKRDDSPTGRSSKRSKRAEASRSLATALLDNEVRLDEEVSFHLGPRVKDMLKDVSEEEALRTAGELTLKLAAIYTKFPRPDQSRMESLEKELAAAKVELREVKALASDLKIQFDRLNGIKAEHAKCAGLLKAADDRAKAEQTKANEAAEELRKLQRRFDDLTLGHMAAAGSASNWQKKAKKFQPSYEWPTSKFLLNTRRASRMLSIKPSFITNAPPTGLMYIWGWSTENWKGSSTGWTR
ncbi:hypothetical protein DEO72_LG8g1261 [Vigna unguiculata]|uniref:Uncharacterized protein n=1 Tax=Vigna unguiculata TaxID=3917 RepID=A0A4D6MTM8_VIGUN|nr:hypothetical protein DEO72_LG8g1261 [Vigna unguiculata]